MSEIWYLLRCPVGNEKYYAEKCQIFVDSEELEEIICFRYQRMIRYGGRWHLEKRIALPGHLFLSGINVIVLVKNLLRNGETKPDISLTPCDRPYLKGMCQRENLVNMSRGIIRNGSPVVTSGPLKGREQLIQRIDRHKRTAEIEIPFAGDKKQVTVGLEIYKKEM